jgi:hypothetical protein
MGDVVVSEFVTLDGVFEDPGGSENSRFGFAGGDSTAAFELVDCRPAAQTAILVYGRPRA